MIEDAALPVAILLHYAAGRYGSGPRMVAHPVRIDTTNGREHPRGMIDEPLDGLTIGAYIDTDTPDENGRARTYGWSVDYRDLHAVDLPRADTMARTLRAVAARMTRTAARYGTPVTFGAYLLHAAAALRIDRFIYRDSEEPYSGTYADVAWTITDPAGADAWTLTQLRRAARPLSAT